MKYSQGHSHYCTMTARFIPWWTVQKIRALGNSDRRLTKITGAHMYGRRPVCVSRTCRCACLPNGGDENCANNHARYSTDKGVEHIPTNMGKKPQEPTENFSEDIAVMWAIHQLS